MFASSFVCPEHALPRLVEIYICTSLLFPFIRNSPAGNLPTVFYPLGDHFSRNQVQAPRTLLYQLPESLLKPSSKVNNNIELNAGHGFRRRLGSPPHLLTSTSGLETVFHHHLKKIL
ncbi:hypothetical protein PROFUN_16675 [Planoprotostelium fungivorum]|uniref:Uncharacterized protein n=1 Tax=Planoprotostelium fungivorum TaxID=1890364 RepID=A0A2P6MP28_9EUKA|nr:hypothetical protein PROFUN_16675 [Planoprotostelium fungivorum]